MKMRLLSQREYPASSRSWHSALSVTTATVSDAGRRR